MATHFARRPTINDVAALAGVSKKTVSKVANRTGRVTEATLCAVQTAIRTLGFVPSVQAQGLALKHSGLVALVHDLPLATATLDFQIGVLDAIGETELALAVLGVERGATAALERVATFLERHRPLGVILSPRISGDQTLIQLIDEMGVRYIRIGAGDHNDVAQLIRSDHRLVVERAVLGLIAAGHTHLSFVHGEADHPIAQEQLAGFDAGIAFAGSSVSARLFAMPDDGVESGVAAGNTMLSLNDRPSAVLCSSGELAAGVTWAGHRRGVAMPDQLLVAGLVEDSSAAQLWSGYQAIRWPARGLGHTAASQLIADLPDRWKKHQHLSPPLLSPRKPRLILHGATERAPPASRPNDCRSAAERRDDLHDMTIALRGSR